MVLALHVQVGEATVAVEELDPLVAIAQFDAALAFQFKAGPFVETKRVVMKIQADAETAAQSDSCGPLPFHMDAGFEMVCSIVDLDSVLHRSRATDGLDIEAGNRRQVRPWIITAHLDIDAESDASAMVEYFRVQTCGPAGSVLVEAGTDDARIAGLVVRLEARIERPGVRILSLFHLDQGKDLVGDGRAVVLVAALEKQHRVERLDGHFSLAHSGGDGLAAFGSISPGMEAEKTPDERAEASQEKPAPRCGMDCLSHGRKCNTQGEETHALSRKVEAPGFAVGQNCQANTRCG